MKIEEKLRIEMKENNAKYGCIIPVGVNEKGIIQSRYLMGRVPITEEAIEEQRNKPLDPGFSKITKEPTFIELEDHELKKAAATSTGCLLPIIGMLMIFVLAIVYLVV